MIDTIELTPREKQVARLLSRGYSAVYIARRLYISKRTVETHVGRIYGKLGVSTRDELIERAEHGTLYNVI